MPALLIVAADVPSVNEAQAIAQKLPDEVLWYKVGLELFTSDGPSAVIALKSMRKNVFLDLKLHDIPRTVANAVAAAARHGVNMLTVHALGGPAMLKAAAESAMSFGENRPKLVAVTTLTSLSQNDLTSVGISRDLATQTLEIGKMAIAAGIDGLVCSPLEASLFRRELGPSPILVTPGIRPAGADIGDQKRVATPESAIRAGASFLVVGRPILDAPNPRQAALDIITEMQSCSMRK